MSLALALLLQASQPLAGQLPPPPDREPSGRLTVEPLGMFIAGCDANGDARTSAAELTACIARSFAGASSSGRAIGYIEYGDWAKHWLGDANALPSAFEIDANGDNQITLDELQARFATVFARLDKNHDGQVSRDELIVSRPGGGEGAGPGGQRPGGFGGSGGGRRGRRGGGGGGGFPGGGGGGMGPGGD